VGWPFTVVSLRELRVSKLAIRQVPGQTLVMPAEERKLATVLFADLVGSTELAGDQDPERVRAMLDRFYDAMAAEIERAGGTVEKFVGDAVMAAFGARPRMRTTRNGPCMWRWGCGGEWASCSAGGSRCASA
jgi:class 3 adenylate cyclase